MIVKIIKSKMDSIYRSFIITKMFGKGWGDVKSFETLFEIRTTLNSDIGLGSFFGTLPTVTITDIQQHHTFHLMSGEFVTPLYLKYPNLIPPTCYKAKFEVLLPLKWTGVDLEDKPMCIHLAGTGDHHYKRRRRFLAEPLLNDCGIGAILLETPYYGSRKPTTQHRSNLHYVCDVFVIGACLMLECFVLLDWCERQGFGPLGISGVSMGGHMASLAATIWRKPLVLVPCLSWTTASTVFTHGVMARSVDWTTLTKEYHETSALQGLFDNLFDVKISEKDFSRTDNYYSVDHPFRKTFFTRETIDLRVLNFMGMLMDYFTELRNFPKLVDPGLCIVVCALYDAYVPRDGCVSFTNVWEGAEIRYLNTGHISAVMFHQEAFKRCIGEAFQRARDKLGNRIVMGDVGITQGIIPKGGTK